jgi:hypothetical protein
MTKYCSDCENPTETEYLCSHCDEPICPDCAEEVDEDEEEYFTLEERDVIFTVCRRCKYSG